MSAVPGDLSTTIGETLLLRKHASMMRMGYATTPDSELSAHELRIKHEGVATEAQLALAHKVYREGGRDWRRAVPRGAGRGRTADRDGCVGFHR